jgi:diadenosine tetraphosphate (Ap4A) HIT family hydrolase
VVDSRSQGIVAVEVVVMPRVSVELDEDVATMLAAQAAARGLALDDLLAARVRRRANDLLFEAPEAWAPPEEWDALVRGDGCPLCGAVASDAVADAHGHTVADLRLSRLRLASNQSSPGYCILICARHVCEPHELTADERERFFADLCDAGRAIATVFGAFKMNFQLLGNLVPHLHAHITPRYRDDPVPGGPISPDPRAAPPRPDWLAERAEALRAALA